ncbi:DUF3152 domain-containing protein [Streptomyces sp. O3]
MGGFSLLPVLLIPDPTGTGTGQRMAAPAPLKSAPAATPEEEPPPQSEPGTGPSAGTGIGTGTGTGTESSSRSGARTRPPSAPTPTGPARATPSVPATGRGTFTTGSAAGATAGDGRIWRYRVDVEDGTLLLPDEAAREVAAVLADPRGWAAKGTRAFQLVTSGPTDFQVKIATPATVDRLCGEYGLDTHGEVNCRVGTSVVVNLKRWLLGSPQFDGPLSEYRALIINHEVGHRLGHGHLTCAGPGRPAPAMMQQIKGLHGCVANAWPFDENGDYISGPKVD